MKFLGPMAAVCGILAVTFSLSACKTNKVQAADALSQSEAEKLVANTTINDCTDLSQLHTIVRLGTPDPNGRVRERHGATMVYPVQVTWTGNCVGKGYGRTDYFANINAKYETNFWRNDFGEWVNTPYNGLCKRQRVAYKMDGQAKTSIPSPQVEGCSLQDLRNK